jgi:hypothetical protein
VVFILLKIFYFAINYTEDGYKRQNEIAFGNLLGKTSHEKTNAKNVAPG